MLVADGKGSSGKSALNTSRPDQLSPSAAEISSHNAVSKSGRAMDQWRRMIAAQGGDARAQLPATREVHTVTADRSGVADRLDAYKVGVAAWRLGAGRARKEDAVSPGAGVVWHARPGDRIQAGEALFDLHSDDVARFPSAMEALEGCVEIGDGVPQPAIVLERVAGDEAARRSGWPATGGSVA